MRKIKAISLHQPWASMIARGEKTIETRMYKTSHRGELLIASTLYPSYDKLPRGMGLVIVNVIDCRKMRFEDEKRACCKFECGRWAWILSGIRKIKPFHVTGKQGFYYVEIPE